MAIVIHPDTGVITVEAGTPDGDYTHQVRVKNDAGTSLPSNSFTWTVTSALPLDLHTASNTPTSTGATINCESDVIEGSIYAAVWLTRPWHSIAGGSSVEDVAADKAIILAGDHPDIKWAGNEITTATPSLVVDGLPASTGPYYIGWVLGNTPTAPTIPDPVDPAGMFIRDISPFTLVRTGVQTGYDYMDAVFTAATLDPVMEGVRVIGDGTYSRLIEDETGEISDVGEFGVLIEGVRTNLFASPESPVTQGVTVAAEEHAISMTGTGSITLSGAGSGTVTEGSPVVVLTTAGTLTCTLSGSVETAQVEEGGFATSFIANGTRDYTCITGTAAELGLAADITDEVTVYMKVKMNMSSAQSNDVTANFFQVKFNANLEELRCYRSAGSSESLKFRNRQGGSGGTNSVATGGWAKGDVLNIKTRKDSAGARFVVDGDIARVTNTSVEHTGPMADGLSQVVLGAYSDFEECGFFKLQKYEIVIGPVTDGEMDAWS